METDIVLALELHKLDVIGVLPPLLPLGAVQVVAVGVSLGNGDITNASIEPDVENLLFVVFNVKTVDIRDGHTPFQVTRDGSRLETLVDPSIGDTIGVGAPSIVAGGREPLSELAFDSIELQIQVFRLAGLGSGAVKLAARVDQPTSSFLLVVLSCLSRVGVLFRL